MTRSDTEMSMKGRMEGRPPTGAVDMCEESLDLADASTGIFMAFLHRNGTSRDRRWVRGSSRRPSTRLRAKAPANGGQELADEGVVSQGSSVARAQTLSFELLVLVRLMESASPFVQFHIDDLRRALQVSGPPYCAGMHLPCRSHTKPVSLNRPKLHSRSHYTTIRPPKPPKSPCGGRVREEGRRKVHIPGKEREMGRYQGHFGVCPSITL
jgi:hypothetical protein